MRAIVDGLIFETQQYGGISRLYSEILPRMCAMDDSLQITLLTAGKLRQALPAHPRIVHRPHLPVDRIFRPYRIWAPAYPQLRGLLQRLAMAHNGGGIWHSTYYTMPTRWTGPLVVTVVDMIHERFSQIFDTPRDDRFRQRKRQCISAADLVICISHSTQQDVQEFLGIDPQRTRVVPLAYSGSFMVTEPDAKSDVSPTNDPYLLHVGMRSHHKNFRLLFEAYSHWDKRKDFGLVTVGAPWSSEEAQHLAALGISERVHLLTDADDERLCQLYNHATAFVYPSLYEGFGIPLLEAMACGCPIIASRIPSTLEVAQECPIYFEPTQPDDLIAAFDIAVAEGRDSDRVRLGLQLVQGFSWDATAQGTLEVYRALSNAD